MNERYGFGVAALCGVPLLASCMVRWDPSSENDEYWDESEPRPVVSEGAGRWSEPAPTGREPSERRPPLTPESEYHESPEDATASAVADGYRDLIVIDPAIVAGPLAANDFDAAHDAPFSFRAQMQWLGGASRDPLEFTRSWLSSWENASQIGDQLAPVTPRARLRRVLVEPWLAASGVPFRPAATDDSSAADDTEGYGDATGDADAAEPSHPGGDDPYAAAAGEPATAEPGYPATPASGEPEAEGSPSWEYAPFVLIAIVNRVDLAPLACEGYPGELRFVYAAIDPESSRPLDLTLIVEVPYPTTRSAAEWARAWRDLAALPRGAAYTAGLADLVREIHAQGDPLRARLRTNESAFADPAESAWEMRQFDVQVRAGKLELAQVPLEFTPRADVDPAELSAYVLEHADEIEGKGTSLPESWRAAAAQIDGADFSWSVLGVSERLRRAFSVQTCNGCHGGDTAALPFRHIAAGASLATPAKLSRFLYDPDASTDELRRRSALLEALSTTDCEPETPTAGYLGG